LNVNIPLDDQKRLADEVGPYYQYVADAASAYSLQFARAGEEHEFVQDDYVQLAFARLKVALGRWALRRLTEAPEEALPVLADYEDAYREATVELVAERFYDSFVDGDGRFACDNAYASDKAREMMKREKPDCDQERSSARTTRRSCTLTQTQSLTTTRSRARSRLLTWSMRPRAGSGPWNGRTRTATTCGTSTRSGIWRR
jgi:hypothetical protein